MSISIRFPGESDEALQALLALKLQARMVRNAVVFTVQEHSTFERQEVWEFLRAHEGQFAVRLLLTESGGAGTNTGHATIVCKEDGTPFVPIGGGHSCNAIHATFCVRPPAILVSGRWWNKAEAPLTVTIARQGIDIPDRYRETQQILWSGPPSDLPAKYDHLSAAVRAAAGKATSYHCRSALFVADIPPTPAPRPSFNPAPVI